jgi:hypothetical protein
MLTAFWCWLLHHLPCPHILPLVGGCTVCTSCPHIADCWHQIDFLVALTGHWFTWFHFFYCILLIFWFSCHGYIYSNQWVKMAVLQRWVTKKGMNGREMHIESAPGDKTLKNMEKCAYSTGDCDWLCFRVTLRILQQSASKRVNICRWFC